MTVKLFSYHDWQQVADLLRTGDNPRPTYLRMLDTTSIEGAKLLRVGLAAAGEIESVCFVGNRYAAADLAALTGAGQARLEKLNADLWYYALMEFRQPGSADPERIPGFARALKVLEQLEQGIRIFSLQEAGDAGLPDIALPDPSKQVHPIVQNASPLFGVAACRGGGLFRYRGRSGY